MDLSLLTPGPNMPECSFHSRLVLQLPQPSLLETRSQVDWQAWLMPMDCFSCHQGEKLLSILMSKLDVYANLEVNIDANGKVNNSDAKAEAKII